MYQQVIFVIVIFTTIILSSNSFANSSKHSGICEFWVKDGIWKFAGNAYLTSEESDNYYGINLNSIRRVFTTSHQLFNQEKELPLLRTNEEHKPMPFRETKIICGEDEYEVRRIPLKHKPFAFGTQSNESSQICDMDPEVKRQTKISPKIVKRGCDTSIYQIILKSGDAEKLKKINGFSPFANRKHRKEFEGRHVYLGVNSNGLDIGMPNHDCIVERSYYHFFRLKCSSLTKEFRCNNQTLQKEMYDRKLYSGTPILLASNKNTQNIQLSDSKKPIVIGSLVNFSCNIDGTISVEADSLELSNEANQVLGEEITHIEHND